jgi:hypothetical protein
MEIKKRFYSDDELHEAGNEAAKEYERQRELYRQGANNRNIRRQRQTRATNESKPFIKAKPETVARELAKMKAIMEGES